MTPISKELQDQIEREAEDYGEETGEIICRVNEYGTHNARAAGFEAGATAYAHYKECWDQAKKALEAAVTKHEEDKLKLLEKYPQLEGKLEPAILPWVVNAKALLASWKEEGSTFSDKVHHGEVKIGSRFPGESTTADQDLSADKGVSGAKDILKGWKEEGKEGGV